MESLVIQIIKVIKLINSSNLEDIQHKKFNDQVIKPEFYNVIPKLIKEIEYPKLIENGILIIMDIEQDEQVMSLDDINKFRREVQNMRKEAGLQMWNQIKIYYQDEVGLLSQRIKNYYSVMKEMIIYEVYPLKEINQNDRVIISKEVSINQHNVQITLTN